MLSFVPFSNNVFHITSHPHHVLHLAVHDLGVSRMVLGKACRLAKYVDFLCFVIRISSLTILFISSAVGVLIVSYRVFSRSVLEQRPSHRLTFSPRPAPCRYRFRRVPPSTRKGVQSTLISFLSSSEFAHLPFRLSAPQSAHSSFHTVLSPVPFSNTVRHIASRSHHVLHVAVIVLCMYRLVLEKT